MSSNRASRTGVHVTAAPSGCGNCGHPFTLHSNGATPCKAAGCTGGGGSAPCPGFAAAGQGHLAPVLLAS